MVVNGFWVFAFSDSAAAANKAIWDSMVDLDPSFKFVVDPQYGSIYKDNRPPFNIVCYISPYAIPPIMPSHSATTGQAFGLFPNSYPALLDISSKL